MVKQFGDISLISGILQLLIPKWLTKRLNLSFFKLEPINRLGSMFSKILRERRLNGIKYSDLSEQLEDAIDKGLEMDEKTKVGNCLVVIFAGVDTVSNVTCRIGQFLIEYPEIQERLYQELKQEFSDEITYEKPDPTCLPGRVFERMLKIGFAILSSNQTCIKGK